MATYGHEGGYAFNEEQRGGHHEADWTVGIVVFGYELVCSKKLTTWQKDQFIEEMKRRDLSYFSRQEGPDAQR